MALTTVWVMAHAQILFNNPQRKKGADMIVHRFPTVGLLLAMALLTIVAGPTKASAVTKPGTPTIVAGHFVCDCTKASDCTCTYNE